MRVNNIEKVGSSIKKLRKKKSLTIADMALYTGLSVGYLSNVERNLTSPTLRNLSLISTSLGVSITDLILTDSKTDNLIRYKDTVKRTYPEFNQKVDIIDFGLQTGFYEYITIEPGKAKSISESAHPYSEVCTIIQGKLTIIINDIEYDLYKGDSLLILGHQPHILQNNTDELSISFWHIHRPANSN